MIETIRKKMTYEELLLALAEEAAELGHAAMKERRAITGDNPTPTTREAAHANLLEEIADVLCIIKVLNHPKEEQVLIQDIICEKEKRWAKRLEGKSHKQNMFSRSANG